MLERERSLSRRKFSRRKFLRGAVGVLLGLTGLASSERKADRLVTPKRPELATEGLEREREIWPLDEVQNYYPLVFENLSSYKVEGLYRAPFEEAMKEVRVNKGQILGIIFKDTLSPEGKRTIETNLFIYKIKKDGKLSEPFPGSVTMAQDIGLEGTSQEETFSLNTTVSLKVLLAFASRLQPYLADDELTKDEFFKLQQEFNPIVLVPGGLRDGIIKEVVKDKSKLIFIFSPPIFEV